MSDKQENKIEKGLHYFLLYITIICGGSAWISFFGNDQFVLFIFGISLLHFIVKGKIRKSFTVMIVFYSIFCFMAMLYSELSIGTYINILGKVLLSYAVIDFNKEKFVPRLMNLAVILSTISNMIFIVIQVVGMEALAPIYTRLYTKTTDGSYSLGNGYGLLLYRFVPLHSTRNCGIFTEPGEYAIFLCVIIFFMINYHKYLTNKKKLFYASMLVFSLITTQSTSGYFMFLGVVVLGIISRKIRIFNRKTIGIIAIAVILFGNTIVSMYNSTIANKIIEKGAINFNQGTAAARYMSIQSVFEYIDKHPSVLLGMGFEGLQNAGIGQCAGLLAVLLAVGVFAFTILYGFIIGVSFIYKKDITEFLMQIILFLISGLSQPGTAFPIIFMMCMYSYISKSTMTIKSYLV